MHLQTSMAAQALGMPREAARYRRRALESAPRQAVLLHNFAEALREEGSLGEAIEWYELAIAEVATLAPAYAGLGQALYGQARYDEATVQLERAEALLPSASPMAPDLYRSIARTELARGREVGAIRAYQRLLELAPGHPAALAELAVLHFDRDEFAEALRVLEALGEVGPDDPEVHANMGSVLGTLGRLEESLASFDRALALDPASGTTRSRRDAVRDKLAEEGAADAT